MKLTGYHRNGYLYEYDLFSSFVVPAPGMAVSLKIGHYFNKMPFCPIVLVQLIFVE